MKKAKPVNELPKESKSTNFDRLFLVTLLMAEITRLKFGKQKFTLTNPKIESAARLRFAEAAGFYWKSPAKVFLQHLRRVFEENKLLEKFEATMKRFDLNPDEFIYTPQKI